METKIERNTKETQISLQLEHPATKERQIESNCGFLNHMLDLLCHRAGLGICLKAHGDVEIDYHHLTEDVGIALGQALREIAKERPIERYGFLLPMDGSLVQTALDFSGRGALYWSGEFPTEKVADFDLELVSEFFRGFAREAGLTLHIDLLKTDNSHHAAEAVFKAVGMCLKQALVPAAANPSTKGLWL